MKNKFNTLRKYILDNSVKEYRKETVNGLFRSILEPLISNQKFEACVLFRLFDLNEKTSVLNRLTFSNVKMYSFSDKLIEYNLNNSEKENLWDNIEFLVVLGKRYSAALIWDLNKNYNKDTFDLCILYNSKIITDITKCILENSKENFTALLSEYSPDRRENIILNNSINSLVSILNDKNDELFFNSKEKQHLIYADDSLKTAKIVSDKAKFIAHEIKNNLSIINLYSKIVEKKLEKLDIEDTELDSIKKSLYNITGASENISNFINDLRCLSAPYKSEVDVKNLILNTVAQCEQKALNAGIKVNVNDFASLIVNTDKTKLQCALMNIIYNAIEACTNNCEIFIDCIVELNLVKIVIKNTGDMIPIEIQEKIFESDFTTKEKGNGLGLAICKKQLELLNGDIILVSSDNKETVFEIDLPLK